MATQLSLFQSPIRRKRSAGNPYRSINGRYCSKQEAEQAAKELEMRKLKEKAAFLEHQVAMYERMAIALSKRLRNNTHK